MYATEGLLDALLEEARERSPGSVTIPLGVTAAGDLPGVDLPAGAQVFTHLYLPEAGESVREVFGVDLVTPPGRTPGVFVSHPDGLLALRRRDDLREVVLIAVPPWDRDAVAAFDRRGSERSLDLLDVEPPRETAP